MRAGARGHGPDRGRLGTDCRAERHRLRRVLARERVSEDRSLGEVLVRRLERARRTDQARRSGRRVRGGEPGAAHEPRHEQALLEARRLRPEPDRADRATLEPRAHPQRLRPAQARREAGHRRTRRPRRQLHDPRVEDAEADGRALARGQPRERRARGARQGRAERGGRGVRLLDRCTHRSGQGPRAEGPGKGAAEDPVRHLRGRGELAEAGGAGLRPARPRASRAKDPRFVRLPAAHRAEALVRRALPVALAFGAATVALAFLALPVVAIFTRVPPGRLVHLLASGVVTDALVVSVKTTLIAEALILLFGTPLAYLLATRRFPGRAALVTLVELPLVLPPAVAGIGLFAAFGRSGLLGSTLDAFGLQIPFTLAAVVLAIAFVGSPLFVRTAIASFEAVDPDLVAASRTLGAGPTRTFFRVALPLARGGLAASAALAFARALGEFGATIMFAGSLRGVTQTLPLAIYEEFSVTLDTALAMGALLVVVSVALLLSLKLALSWQPSRRTSVSLFARSS